MLTIPQVAALARTLPDCQEGERYGSRSWSVHGKAFAWERPFSKADLKRYGSQPPPDGPIVAIRVADLSEKAAVLAADPEAFFTIPHFDNYAAVLVTLPVANRKAVQEALVDGWLCCAPAELVQVFLAAR